MKGKKAAITGAITIMGTPKKGVPIIVDIWLPLVHSFRNLSNEIRETILATSTYTNTFYAINKPDD